MSPKWVRVRLLAVTAVLGGLFVALAGKAWTLQIHDGARMGELSRKQHARELSLPPPRGSIRDVNGVELAVTVDVSSAFVNPREVADVAAAAPALAAALGLDVREVEEKLASSRRFEWLKRHIRPDQARLVRALSLRGIGVVAEPRRFYPARELAGTILGFAGLDGRGLEGIELSLDALLRGERRSSPVIRDRRGDLVIPTDSAPASVPGAHVTLTIDRFIQWTVERALTAGVTEHQAKAGIVVVLDPRTGGILAMASWPPLDPNAPARAGHEARNRAVADAYEPGSVMKVFSVVAALDAGAISASEMIDVEGGRLQIGRRVITDTHKGENLLSIGDIVKYSSNVGAIKIARRLGKERLHDALVRFGFGAKTGVELPGERQGRVRAASTWGESGLATHSYGYGLLATPLQVAAAMNAVATGGIYRRPHIVRRVVAPSGEVKDTPVEERRVLDARVAQTMNGMLQLVTQKGGTADKVRVPGFAVAGKTGTAYKLDAVTKRYAKDRYLSSFMGYVPAEDPRLVVLVLIDEPSAGKHYGGTVAGPVFAAIATESLRYLGVPATQPLSAEPPAEVAAAPALEEAPDIEILADEPPLDDELVIIPDFTSLSVGQAVALARARGLRLEIEGTGSAIEQFPPPGPALKSIACHVTFDPG